MRRRTGHALLLLLAVAVLACTAVEAQQQPSATPTTTAATPPTPTAPRTRTITPGFSGCCCAGPRRADRGFVQDSTLFTPQLAIHGLRHGLDAEGSFVDLVADEAAIVFSVATHAQELVDVGEQLDDLVLPLTASCNATLARAGLTLRDYCAGLATADFFGTAAEGGYGLFESVTLLPLDGVINEVGFGTPIVKPLVVRNTDAVARDLTRFVTRRAPFVSPAVNASLTADVPTVAVASAQPLPLCNGTTGSGTGLCVSGSAAAWTAGPTTQAPRVDIPGIVARLRFDAVVRVCLTPSAFQWQADGGERSCIAQYALAPDSAQRSIDPRSAGGVAAAFAQRPLCADYKVFVPNVERPIVTAVRYLSIATATVSFIAAPPSGIGAAAALDAQTVAVIGLMSCSTTSDRAVSRGLRFFLSPVAEIDNYTIVLYVNTQIAVAVVVLHAMLVCFKYRHDEDTKAPPPPSDDAVPLRRRSSRSSSSGNHNSSAGRRRRSVTPPHHGGHHYSSSDNASFGDAAGAGLVTQQSLAMELQAMRDEQALVNEFAGAEGIVTEGRRRANSLADTMSDAGDDDHDPELDEDLVRRRRSKFSSRRFTAMAAKMRFPSMSFLVALLMFQGIVYASVHLSAYSTDTLVGTAGVIGVLFVLVFIGFTSILVQQQRLRFFPYRELVPLGIGTLSSGATATSDTDEGGKGKALLSTPECPLKDIHPVPESSQKDDLALTGRWWLRWFYPIGTWGPSQPRLMYSKLFSAYTGSARQWFAFPLLVVCVVNVFAVVHPRTLRGCATQFAVISAFYVLCAVIIIVRQPLRAMYKNVLSSVAYLCFAVTSIGRAIHLNALGSDAAGLDTSTYDTDRNSVLAWRGSQVALGGVIFQVVLIGVRATMDAIFTTCESKVWRPRNTAYQEAEQATKRRAPELVRRERREARRRQRARATSGLFVARGPLANSDEEATQTQDDDDDDEEVVPAGAKATEVMSRSVEHEANVEWLMTGQYRPRGADASRSGASSGNSSRRASSSDAPSSPRRRSAAARAAAAEAAADAAAGAQPEGPRAAGQKKAVVVAPSSPTRRTKPKPVREVVTEDGVAVPVLRKSNSFSGSFSSLPSRGAQSPT